MIEKIFYTLGAILILLIILASFFNYNPISEIKEKVNEIKYDASLEKVIIDEEELIVDNPKTFYFDRFDGIEYQGIVYEEDENTDFIVASFEDNSGYLNNKCLRINQMIISSASRDKVLCNVCSNKTKGKLYCSVYNYTEGIMLGSFYANGGGHTFPIESLESIEGMIIDYAEGKCNEGFEDYC